MNPITNRSFFSIKKFATSNAFCCMCISFMIVMMMSCSDSSGEESTPPSITVKVVSDITYKSAIANVSVLKGSEDIKQVGLRYVEESLTDTVNLPNSSSSSGYIFHLEGLKFKTKYQLYAYVQTAKGTVYKSAMTSFSTLDGDRPIVSAVKLLERSADAVKITTEIESNSDFPVLEKGYYLSSNSDMSNAEKIAVDEMSKEINNLYPRSAYYVQAFAKNEVGESKSETLLFETKSLNGLWTYAFSTEGRAFAVAASDGESLYFGLGCRGDHLYYDWNRYDPKTNSVIPLKVFPGYVDNGLNENHAFIIENDIYVTSPDKGFWKYDIKSDKWINRKETTVDRGHSTGLSINGKGYYGLGERQGSRYRDILEYDPKKDQWTKIAEAPFQFTRNGFFAVGDDIYFVEGENGYYYGSNTRNFYKFNITKREWTKLADFPGKANMDTFGFSIGSRGYVVAGWYEENGRMYFTNEVWEYTPLYDEWERKADYPNAIIGLAGCSVGEKAYVGCGCRFSGYSYTDFYLFDPDK